MEEGNGFSVHLVQHENKTKQQKQEIYTAIDKGDGKKCNPPSAVTRGHLYMLCL